MGLRWLMRMMLSLFLLSESRGVELLVDSASNGRKLSAQHLRFRGRAGP